MKLCKRIDSRLHLVLAMVDQPLGGSQHRVVRSYQLSQVHLLKAHHQLFMLKVVRLDKRLTAMLAKSLSRRALTDRREVG